MNIFYQLGKYFTLLGVILKKPQKGNVFRQQLLLEIENVGIDSLGIVAIVSVFMGAVVAIQTAINIDSPLIPLWAVGFTTRQSIILEFSPTIIALILAGKVGSKIASEIGTMRVTEQIDAMEVMGINSAEYLILPKIVACVIINPVLVIISMFLSMLGGWIVSITTGIMTSYHFIEGLLYDFHTYHVFYALIKTVFFAFIMASVSGYYGYNVKGGALEVGRASTKAVVFSSIYIILFNLILTQLLLS